MRVLVTGATGYVGSRLVPTLLEAGHEVYVGTRRKGGTDDFAWAGDVRVRMYDAEDPRRIRSAVKGMDAVVYLVHSMAGGDFVEKDRLAAERMAAACTAAGVQRIVYLSGLIPPGDVLSDHLASRLEVEQIFLDSPVPTTVLRAAMVIGAGSTSFELLRRLTERVPFTPIPSWMRTSMQPIAVEDVVHLLGRALEGEPRNRPYDVGGDEVFTYPELLHLFAGIVGLQRLQVIVPFVPHRLVGLAVALIAQMPRGTVTALVESLSHDMVCTEDAVRRDLAEPGRVFLRVEEALRRSLRGPTRATSRTGDVQGEADTDAAWSGGSIVVDERGPAVRMSAGVLELLLLGLRTRPRPAF